MNIFLGYVLKMFFCYLLKQILIVLNAGDCTHIWRRTSEDTKSSLFLRSFQATFLLELMCNRNSNIQMKALLSFAKSFQTDFLQSRFVSLFDYNTVEQLQLNEEH